jgi:hypothetical protein
LFDEQSLDWLSTLSPDKTKPQFGQKGFGEFWLMMPDISVELMLNSKVIQ